MRRVRNHLNAIAVGVVVFLVGVGVGVGAAPASEAESDGSDDAATVAAAEPETVTNTETVAETVTETVPATAKQQAALDARSDKLNERAAKVREREKAVRKREIKVGIVERSQFGDGVYLVGKDVPAGSYIASGGQNCYWARLENGSQEIIDNHIGAGQVRVTIYGGELFETTGCGQWRRG
jgi:hypothetical protein